MHFKFIQGIILFLIPCSFFACSPSVYLTYDANKEYGFRLNETESTFFSNPPENKARIYAFRPSIYGYLVSYDMAITYGEFNPKDRFSGKIEFLFTSRGKEAYFKDIDADDVSQITIHAQTERLSTFSFVPKKNLIYCLINELEAGFFIGVPIFTLVDKEFCLANAVPVIDAGKWQKDEQKFKKRLEKYKNSK